MTVRRFRLTNHANKAPMFNWQTGVDADIQVLSVAAGFAPREADTQNMTVVVDIGKIQLGTTLTTTAVQTTSTITAPVTNPRIDRIVMTYAGVISVITGTEAASPSAPAITASQIAIAQIALSVGQTRILNSNITDERPLYFIANVFSTVDINGGTIDNTTIGETTPAVATFTRVALSGAAPSLRFIETDASANNGSWDIIANSEALSFRAAADGFGSATTFMIVDRTTSTIDEIDFTTTSLRHNNVEILNVGSSPTLSGSWIWLSASLLTPITLESTDSSATVGPTFDIFRSSSSPATNDAMGRITFSGKDSGGTTTVYAAIRADITDATDGSEDGRLVFSTIIAGTSATRATLGNGLFMAGATSGDMGAGTINATAVYDDGVILTDYVFDAAVAGDYSVTNYDSRIPTRRREDGSIEQRQHAPARLFKTRFNELDPVSFSTEWKQTRKLPAFNRGPSRKSTGEAIQALIETCEVQAVHIDKLLARISALEALT